MESMLYGGGTFLISAMLLLTNSVRDRVPQEIPASSGNGLGPAAAFAFKLLDDELGRRPNHFDWKQRQAMREMLLRAVRTEH